MRMLPALIGIFWLCIQSTLSRLTNAKDFCGVLTANENLTVFADGSLVGYNVNGGGLYTAKWFSFPSKTKVIAVYVTNGPVWRGEFIGVFSNGVLTDSSWKCKETDNPENGWEQGNFNDDAWPHAYIRVNNSGPTIYGIPTNVHWISPENHVAMSRFICRRRFSEKEENTVSTLISLLANLQTQSIRLYLDGVFTAEANDALTLVKDQHKLQAVHVEDSAPSNDALFLSSSSNGIRTDESWKCTNVYHDGWFLPDYDDSFWPEAFVVGNNTRFHFIAPDAKWIGYVQFSNKIYCRRNTTTEPVTANADFQTSSSYLVPTGPVQQESASAVFPTKSIDSTTMEIKSSPASTYTTTTATTAITKTTTTLTVQIAVATPTITTVPTKSTLPTPTTTITTTASTKAFQNPLKVPKNNQNQDPSYTDANSLSTLDIVVIAVSGCILVAVIIGLVVPCYIWRKRIYKRRYNMSDLKMKDKANDKWEMKKEDVTVCEELGHGAFGRVCKGIIKASSCMTQSSYVQQTSKVEAKSKITVVVKTLQGNATPDQKDDFLEEVNLMKAVGSHMNIVNLIGCCTKSSPNFLIVEFASKGDLLSFLKEQRKKLKDSKKGYPKLRESLHDPLRSQNPKRAGFYVLGLSDISIGEVNVAFSNEDSSTDIRINSAQFLKGEKQDEDEEGSLISQDMMSFSWQIAQGMQYLSGKGIVHGNLAARNVLLCDNKLVKVANFGVARSRRSGLPMKWMSPEAITDSVFTTKSDLWSYGVVLWEIATLGASPYLGIANRELVRMLKGGYRMEKPDTCSDEFYQLMLRCWADSPDARPTFTELCQDLEEWMQQATSYLFMSELSYPFHPDSNIAADLDDKNAGF